MLGRYAPRRVVRSRAVSVDALLDDLEGRFPGLRHRIRDETHQVRPFVKVFVNGREVPAPSLSGRRLRPEDTVDILHSIQGG